MGVENWSEKRLIVSPLLNAFITYSTNPVLGWMLKPKMEVRMTNALGQ
jgi:hypothetical protein